KTRHSGDCTPPRPSPAERERAPPPAHKFVSASLCFWGNSRAGGGAPLPLRGGGDRGGGLPRQVLQQPGEVLDVLARELPGGRSHLQHLVLEGLHLGDVDLVLLHGTASILEP